MWIKAVQAGNFLIDRPNSESDATSFPKYDETKQGHMKQMRRGVKARW